MLASKWFVIQKCLRGSFDRLAIPRCHLLKESTALDTL